MAVPGKVAKLAADLTAPLKWFVRAEDSEGVGADALLLGNADVAAMQVAAGRAVAAQTVEQLNETIEPFGFVMRVHHGAVEKGSRIVVCVTSASVANVLRGGEPNERVVRAVLRTGGEWRGVFVVVSLTRAIGCAHVIGVQAAPVPNGARWAACDACRERLPGDARTHVPAVEPACPACAVRWRSVKALSALWLLAHAAVARILTGVAPLVLPFGARARSTLATSLALFKSQWHRVVLDAALDVPSPDAIAHADRVSDVDWARLALARAAGQVHAFVNGATTARELEAKSAAAESKLKSVLSVIDPRYEPEVQRRHLRDTCRVARSAMERRADMVLARVLQLRGLDPQRRNVALSDALSRLLLLLELQRTTQELESERVACVAAADAADEAAERAGATPHWYRAKAKAKAERAQPRPRPGESVACVPIV